MKLKFITGLSILVFFIFSAGVLLLGRGRLIFSVNTVDGKSEDANQINAEGGDERKDLESKDIADCPPKATSQRVELNLDEVSRHSQASSCWMAIDGKVYDVTQFINSHPGGAKRILEYCGKDASAAFATMGNKGKPHSAFARSLLANYLVGDLGSFISITPQAVGNNADSCESTTQSSTQSAPSGDLFSSPTTVLVNPNRLSDIPASVRQKYPDAILKSGKYEDNKKWEGKIITGSFCREIKVNSSGEIVSDKSC
jgi:cytochrome b involved in lipid metabolism